MKLLAPHGRAGKSYAIHINGSDTRIYRPYRDEVAYSDTKTASLGKLKSFEIESIDGDAAAVGWLIHHDYQGAIPSHKVFVACAHESETSRSAMIACSPRYFRRNAFVLGRLEKCMCSIRALCQTEGGMNSRPALIWIISLLTCAPQELR